MKSLRQPAFNRNRLPNLSEVLNELTLEPVDLRSFLEFMQNQQKSSDYLDFLYVFLEYLKVALVRVPDLFS